MQNFALARAIESLPEADHGRSSTTNYLFRIHAQCVRARTIASQVSGFTLSSATVDCIRLTALLLHESDYASNGKARSAGTLHRTESGTPTPLSQASVNTAGILDGQMKRVMYWATTRCSSIPDAQVLLTEPLLCHVVCGAAIARGTAAIAAEDLLDPRDAWINAVLEFVNSAAQPKACLSLEWLLVLLEVTRDRTNEVDCGRLDTPPPVQGHSSVVPP
jgi:hypothetical protein